VRDGEGDADDEGIPLPSQQEGQGERRKLSQWGSGQSQNVSNGQNFYYFSKDVIKL